jgi:hypothetical protein
MKGVLTYVSNNNYFTIKIIQMEWISFKRGDIYINCSNCYGNNHLTW